LAVKGVLFDVDGPLLVKGQSKPSPGIPEVLKALRERSISIGAMSSVKGAETRLTASGLNVDWFGTAVKGSGKLFHEFCSKAGIERWECIAVIDDEYGFREAINACTIAFHAEWGRGSSKYGIRLEQPEELVEYLDVFFLKKHLWFGRLDANDGNGRDVVLRALIDGKGAGDHRMKSMLYKTLKERQEVNIADGASLSSFLMTHLFASAYLEGLFSNSRDRLFFQIYSASSPQTNPPQIIQATVERFKLFRSANLDAAGLRRHTPATQSYRARMERARENVKFTNQMNSIVLPSTFMRNVKDRRVYVIDDFTTKGYSLEAARNMFYAAGARSVFLLAFGKYSSEHGIQTPQPGVKITPTRPSQYAETDFFQETHTLTVDQEALTEFKESVNRLKECSIRTKLLESSP